MANPITQTPFPQAKYLRSVKFLIDDDAKGKVPNSVLRTLYSHGCVELDNLPACNLQNDTHPCLGRARFRDLTEAVYRFLEPAVTLASRFINNRQYLDFWTDLAVEKTKGTN